MNYQMNTMQRNTFPTQPRVAALDSIAETILACGAGPQTAARVHLGLAPLLFFFFALVPTWATAGMQVNPIRVELTAASPISAITITNEAADSATTIQTRIVSWRRVDGVDSYDASEDLVVTPPIFTLAPGGTQIVRVGLRKNKTASVEGTYRVYLSEIAKPAKPGFQGLNVTLNVGVPVFVLPNNASSYQLEWSIEAGESRSPLLIVKNKGNIHAQLHQIEFTDEAPNQESPYKPIGEGGYLHAGQRLSWPLSLQRTTKGRLKVIAQSRTGRIESFVE
jgi:fimbrial chaperone protein